MLNICRVCYFFLTLTLGILLGTFSAQASSTELVFTVGETQKWDVLFCEKKEAEILFSVMRDDSYSFVSTYVILLKGLFTVFAERGACGIGVYATVDEITETITTPNEVVFHTARASIPSGVIYMFSQ